VHVHRVHLANLHYILICCHFPVNAIWLAPLYYVNSRNTERNIIFFNLRSLFQEANWGVKQGLGLPFRYMRLPFRCAWSFGSCGMLRSWLIVGYLRFGTAYGPVFKRVKHEPWRWDQLPTNTA